jgi:hypothetical protein
MAESETGTPTEREFWKYGVTFGGHFTTEDEARAMMGKVEHYLMTELGLTQVRGGVIESPGGEALCGCDSRDECDERPGCVFN